MNEQLETLAAKIEAKRKPVSSQDDLNIVGWASIDSYNLALTEATEIIRAEIEEKL